MNARLSAFIQAAQDHAPVAGLTHSFYRYPARFSPAFAREAVRAFSKPGQVVLDPFVGGGTTLVEASYLGRKAVGLDVSTLATFISAVKTTPLSAAAREAVVDWSDGIDGLRRAPTDSSVWSTRDEHLRGHLDGMQTWRLREAIGAALHAIQSVENRDASNFLRCCLLRTAQWALDGRVHIPPVAEFRRRFRENAARMLVDMGEYAEQIVANHNAGLLWPDGSTAKIINTSAANIGELGLVCEDCPSLVLTSPPYPGVHVLYHRWQIRGRRETAAAFWIADRADGNPTSTYTMDTRRSAHHDRYFERLRSAFSALQGVVSKSTTIVQLVAFSDPDRQLPRYLTTMTDAGFVEVFLNQKKTHRRIWRAVPHRKWYAFQQGAIGPSREVVLIHRKA